jgi:putative membrane protein
MLWPVLARAHSGDAQGWTSPGALSAWDLAVLALLGTGGGLYLAGVARLRRRQSGTVWYEPWLFALGWCALVIAAMPPLDAVAIELFSVHMIQHELIMLVGVPLVVAGRPLSACLWGMPGNLRRAAGRWLKSGALAGARSALTAPIVAWALHGGAIWLWHVPALYRAAVMSEGVHALQHATFAGTAALFWWGLLGGQYGRVGYGAAVFYVFTTAIHTGLLGATLTLSPQVLYPVYEGPARARGVDVLADQQLAGLFMWIPGGVVLMLLGIAIFAAWLGAAERRQSLREQSDRPRRPMGRPNMPG